MPVSPLGPALPPALASYVRDIAAHGAAPHRLEELNTKVPGLGPYTMDFGGAYTVTAYPGPVTRFQTTPKLGAHVDTTA